MTEVTTLETLTLWRREGDQITNAHLYRLAGEGWYLTGGKRAIDCGIPGYQFTFERRVTDASVARLMT